MNSYTPQIGHQVLVDLGSYGDHHLQIEKINDVATDSSWILLYHGEPGEQRATREPNGTYRLQESGQLVFLLNPWQRPERSGVGIVAFREGKIEEWYMDAEHDPGYAEGFLHAEQYCGIAHIKDDGTWEMNDTDQIFFIPQVQADLLTDALDAYPDKAEDGTPFAGWEIGETVIFGGDKAGTITASGGEGPWPIISGDTRDEPNSFYWLHLGEFTPTGIFS
jgi:hypothetical protein